MSPGMNNGLRLALSLSVLLAAPAAMANPGAEPPPDATVVVVSPAAPVVVGVPSQPMPPGAAEVPPQPAAVAAAPAPQNEPWDNVSHINGHPVPVGERGNYLHKWKKSNIATNPIGWLVGFYGLSASHALGHHVALRGDANLFHEMDSDARGYEFGLTLPLYFKRVYQGPFFEPGVLVRDLNSTDDKRAFVGAQMSVGWHWTFDSGLNLAVAGGLARRMNNNEDHDSFESPIEPVGYFRVGYAY